MHELPISTHIPRDCDRRLRALVAMAPIAMLESTPEGTVSWANDCWYELTTTTSNTSTRHAKQHWFDLVHPDDTTRVLGLWQASTTQRATFTIECRIAVPDGATRQIEFRATPIIEPSTGTMTYALTAMDVTEKRHLNEMTRTTEDLEVWAEQSAATLAEQGRDLGIFAALVASSADAIAIVDPGETLRYANAAFHELFDVVIDIAWPDLLSAIGVDENTARSLHAANLTGKSWQSLVALKRPGREPLHTDISSFSIMDGTWRKIGLAIVIRDLSAHNRVEIERARLHAEIIAAQESAIRELSTPLLPIGPGILTMPLVGNIDTNRGRQILDTLLSGIHEHHATVAILDVTGVREINADVADILLRSAQAAKLLGTNVILTGVGSFVAKTLIQLGADLSGISTLATLEQGIRAAFTYTRSHKVYDRRNVHPLST